MKQNLAVELTETGYVPDGLIRHGIRKLLRQRLDEINSSDPERMAQEQMKFIDEMNNSAIALVPQLANEQHYEVPQLFYKHVLGPHGKYSCCYWDENVANLANAEQVGLEKTCKHAGIEDGMNILELGCGWGSLTLWIASRYPNCNITAVSNSNSGEFNCQVVAEFYLPANTNIVILKKIAYRAAAVSRYVYLKKPIAVIIKNEIHEGRSILKVRLKAYVLDLRYEFAFASEMTELVIQYLLQKKIVKPEELSLIDSAGLNR